MLVVLCYVVIQTLSETKDRKDKILTKLYKRRVELDFSRKGSTAPRSGSFTTSTTATAATTDGTPVAAAAVSTVPPASTRTIAASLTCCRHCGLAYLDNYVSLLTCRASPPTVDFRGQLASRHSAIVGWSLTSYLKTLHSGGMGWDAIYWHVWAACVVFRVDGVMISALEVDRYAVEPDGLLIRGRYIQYLTLFCSVDGCDCKWPSYSVVLRCHYAISQPLISMLYKSV